MTSLPDAPAVVARPSPSRLPRRKSTYEPHIDGLRALAILGVLSEHFGLAMPDMLRFGPLSVRFFFVLSGYFITLSLWKIQDRSHTHGGLARSIGGYLLRRLQRIGPPFYLALVIGALFGVEEIRTNFFWLATFQANNYIAHLGYWPSAVSHFWSLAVQEQFYLVWPIVVLTLPRRWFLPVMAAFIVSGLLFRVGCMVTGASTLFRWITLFGCLDSFAVGALVAYLRDSRLLNHVKLFSKTVLMAMPLAAFACFFLGRALMTLPETNLFLALAESLDAVFLAWLLSMALVGITGPYGRVLGWAPLVYLGRISYGIYIYHVFVIILLSPLLLHWGLTTSHFALVRLTLLYGFTIGIASLSWHFLEKPCLAWKGFVTEPRASAPTIDFLRAINPRPAAQP